MLFGNDSDSVVIQPVGVELLGHVTFAVNGLFVCDSLSADLTQTPWKLGGCFPAALMFEAEAAARAQLQEGRSSKMQR